MKWWKKKESCNKDCDKVSELAERIKVLECNHDEWSYGDGDENVFYFYFGSPRYKKTCNTCGKVVYMLREEWLQEQADLHYKKHEQFIEQLNKYYEEG